jgi:hypothetical protein
LIYREKVGCSGGIINFCGQKSLLGLRKLCWGCEDSAGVTKKKKKSLSENSENPKNGSFLTKNPAATKITWNMWKCIYKRGKEKIWDEKRKGKFELQYPAWMKRKLDE